ncbi:hypothetical protein RchiOBHm_Chr6g0300121 [Rosa chinensis]|uniref:Cytochrome P450 n=1 Tax=Rosa chinensis TaxID=74649 RepID=A0A2P6PYE1_ROSCH|nr:hypothetical protein RchiOBHm_Chr6g0300121 [Rosa chinensis]
MVASSRPKMAAVEIIGYNYAVFGFRPSGPYWREVRKSATLELHPIRFLDTFESVKCAPS